VVRRITAQRLPHCKQAGHRKRLGFLRERSPCRPAYVLLRSLCRACSFPPRQYTCCRKDLLFDLLIKASSHVSSQIPRFRGRMHGSVESPALARAAACHCQTPDGGRRASQASLAQALPLRHSSMRHGPARRFSVASSLPNSSIDGILWKTSGVVPRNRHTRISGSHLPHLPYDREQIPPSPLRVPVAFDMRSRPRRPLS
jgi:hypothetical protein